MIYSRVCAMKFVDTPIWCLHYFITRMNGNRGIESESLGSILATYSKGRRGTLIIQR